MRNLRSNRGTSLIEVLAGMMVIVPIGLASIDFYVVIIGNQINNRLVEDAARSAGNQLGSNNAESAARQTVDGFQFQAPVVNVTLSDFNYNVNSQQVLAGTTLTLNLPVPIMQLSSITLHATAIEPIVAIPAPL
jgi:hypothetical protein